jgi:hypothetical protein
MIEMSVIAHAHWRTLANGIVAHVPLRMLRDISSRILRKPLRRLDKGPVKVASFLVCLSEEGSSSLHNHDPSRVEIAVCAELSSGSAQRE